MGLVPTGKQFEALLILVHRVVGGKITDEWTQGSGLAELTQRRLEQEWIEREHVEQESSYDSGKVVRQKLAYKA